MMMTKLYKAIQVKPFIGTASDIARKIGIESPITIESGKVINGFEIKEIKMVKVDQMTSDRIEEIIKQTWNDDEDEW